MPWNNQQANPVTTLTKQGSLVGTAFTVAAAATKIILPLTDVSKYPSYDMSGYFFNTSQSTAGACLSAPVILTWYDDLVTNIPVYTEEWDVWIGNNNGTNVLGTNYPAGTFFGNGPMHGRYLTVAVSEEGGVNGFTCLFVNLYGSNKVVPRANWRQSVPAMNSGLTQITSSLLNQYPNNVLMNVNGFSIGIGATLWLPCQLYSGTAWFRFRASVALSNDVCLTIGEPRITQNGTLIAGAGGAGIIADIGPSMNDPGLAIQLPRAPMYLVVHNGTAAPISIGAALIAQEVA